MASPFAPSFIDDLPSELLLSILSYATLNGDIASLRLVNARFNNFIIEQHQPLFQYLCTAHRLTDRLLKTYFSHPAVKGDGIEGLILLSQEVSTVRSLSEGEQQTTGGDHDQSVTNLLWFSTFTRALRAGLDTRQPLRDILAPSNTIDSALPLALDSSFQHWLKEDLSLTELEAIITAINIAASRLWSSVFLYKAHSSRVNTFASLSGHTFNIEQAILTEHVIWQGPRWTGRMLISPGQGKTDDLEHRLHLLGPWSGSNEDGARIAANGLARLLWKERQRKVDEGREMNIQQTAKGQVTITTLPINPVVWRGNSGDL